MYPYLRFARALWGQRGAPALPLTGTHVSQHVCLPWDIDPFLELNNGRALTLYDLGRFGGIQRTGLWDLLRRERWGATVAGSTVRYRRRLRTFDRFEMRTRVIGWDARFLYIEQGMWRRGDCASHLLVRAAFTDAGGLVPMDRVSAAYGGPEKSPPLPDWVRAWIDAETLRPWPPMQDGASDGAPRAGQTPHLEPRAQLPAGTARRHR